MVFITRDGKEAFVAPGSAGNYTFYLRDLDKPRTKGKRVKGRKSPLWFATASEAEAALVDYAKERGWKQEITL